MIFKKTFSTLLILHLSKIKFNEILPDTFQYINESTTENIEKLTALGVDYISSGALTHSAPILDLSLKNLQVK